MPLMPGESLMSFAVSLSACRFTRIVSSTMEDIEMPEDGEWDPSEE